MPKPVTVTVRCVRCSADVVKDITEESPPVCADAFECDHRVVLLSERFPFMLDRL